MRGQVKATEDGQQEAQWVIGKLQDLIKNGGFQPRDCAILFRRHMQARLFEQAMVRLLYFYYQGHLLRQDSGAFLPPFAASETNSSKV